MPPSTVLWALVVSSILAGAGRAVFVSRVLGMRIADWLRGVVVPCCVIAAVCSAAAAAVLSTLGAGIERVVLLFGLNSVLTFSLTWLFASSAERTILRRHLHDSIEALGTKLQAFSGKRQALFDSNPSA
jgi:hypothetical protein